VPRVHWLTAVRNAVWPPRPSTWFYLLVAVLASAPAWIVRYPPLQDMPFHLAAMRVIHDYGSAPYRFHEYYDLSLGSTQYLLYYLLGSALAYVLGVWKANVVLMSVALGGSVLAMRSLLEALGKDGRLALLVVPLLPNVMFFYGLLPFVFGFPLLFWALAAAARWFERPTRANAAWVVVLSCMLFFAHAFVFGLFAVGFAAMFPWGRPASWLRAGLPSLPCILLVVWWTQTSKAGQESMAGLFHQQGQPLNTALPGVFSWLLDVFRDQTDELWFAVWGFVVAIVVGLSQGDGEKVREPMRGYFVLPLVSTLLYFVTGDFVGPVWLVSQRFPILALMLSIPLLRMPKGARAPVALLAMLVAGAGSTVNVCKHFIQFQLEEVGDIDDAIGSMEPGKKVAGLIFDRGSNVTNGAPFLHFVSYYQLHKGGAVQFSYATWDHWPFHFKPGMEPPPGGRVRPRWEWTPEQVPISELYPYYDYVLVRGGGFSPPPGTFHASYRGEKWTVWKRE
jgi:hypothetical protein